MSAVSTPDPFRTHMLRSSTPASSEKVLLYLEGMQKYPPIEDDEDGASDAGSGLGSNRVRSPPPKSTSSARRLEELPEEEAEYEEGTEIRSDIQENASEGARTIGPNTEVPEHEPGPNDPPGPKFESFGSSFGNFGPLPTGDSNAGVQDTPSRSNAAPLPGSPSSSHPNPFQQWGLTPATGVGVPLPLSVASGGINPPASPSVARSKTHASRASNKSPPPVDTGMNAMLSPKSASRALSPTRTGNGTGERPWSPRTVASQVQSVKSRNTQKTNRTVYPPLPESVAEDFTSKAPTQRVPSPVDRRTNKSPSIAPSDSQSQAASKRSAAKLQQMTREPSHKPSKSVKSTVESVAAPAPPPVETASRYATSQRNGRSQVLSPRSQAPQLPVSPTRSNNDELLRAAAALSPARSRRALADDPQATPTPSRPISPMDDLDAEEQRMVNNVLTARSARSRTSYAASTMAPSVFEAEVQQSHFHDMELCQLLHALDQPMGEPVKKAVRKAVRARVKKLGMKYDNESIRQYRKSYHDHDPSVHLAAALVPPQPSSKRSTQIASGAEPPEWAKDLIQGMINVREKLDSLAPQIERNLRSSQGGSVVSEGRGYQTDPQHPYTASEMNAEYTQSPMMTQTGGTDFMHDSAHIHMHPHDGSMQGAVHEDDIYEDEADLHGQHMLPPNGDMNGYGGDYMPHERNDSPGQQYLEEELYKLRVKPTGSQSVAATHKTWEVARDDGEEYDDGDAQAAVTESGMPEIPDGMTGAYTDNRGSPPLPPIPHDARNDLVNMPAHQMYYGGQDPNQPTPWQRIYQRLLTWAIVWPMSDLDAAVNSTTRGMQINEIALSIWSTQTYKRYVRSKITDSPQGRVDRLLVPPNMADAISTAVFNGRHGDACRMLKEMWAPFGLEGIPRLLVVLAKHRNDPNHWVVHRFSLPEGTLTTYDTYPERCLPDGRPLGWWFAIRIAWPEAIYPSPDRLMQKLVRLHRPMQLGIDNSVAAAGICRNILMGSRAERSLDLERLRDLINTDVKNLRQRKIQGKLSIETPRPVWEDMN